MRKVYFCVLASSRTVDLRIEDRGFGPTATGRYRKENPSGQTVQPEDREVRARATAESAAIRVALGLALVVAGAFGVLTNRLIRASV